MATVVIINSKFLFVCQYFAGTTLSRDNIESCVPGLLLWKLILDEGRPNGSLVYFAHLFYCASTFQVCFYL